MVPKSKSKSKPTSWVCRSALHKKALSAFCARCVLIGSAGRSRTCDKALRKFDKSVLQEGPKSELSLHKYLKSTIHITHPYETPNRNTLNGHCRHLSQQYFSHGMLYKTRINETVVIKHLITASRAK